MAIDSWSILRHTHKIGSLISGTVASLDPVDTTYDIPGGFIHLNTASVYPAILPYHCMANDPSNFDPADVPPVGSALETAVLNFVDGTLYLTARPSDLAVSRVAQWRRFYEFLDTLQIGNTQTGVVKRIEPFGLFVDIGSEFDGLIDIGHAAMVSTPHLPHDPSMWPKVGDTIDCRIEYLRLNTQQIGMGWLPNKTRDNG